MTASSPPAPYANPQPPPWQGELRNFLKVTNTLSLVWVLVSGVLALIFLVYLVIDLFHFGFGGDIIAFLYWGISALVSLFIHVESRGWISLAEAGQYQALRDRMLLWAILGLIFGVLLGLLLILIYLRLESAGGGFLSGSQPQPPIPAQPAPPPVYGVPPPQTPPAVNPGTPRPGLPPP